MTKVERSVSQPNLLVGFIKPHFPVLTREHLVNGQAITNVN